MATFETLAAKCAAGVALDLLVAIANVESDLQPLAVRDGSTLLKAGSVGEGMALAVGASDQGREPRIGLMGLNEQQLRSVSLSLADGFDACRSLSAAAAIITASKGRTAAQPVNVEAADWAVARTWWHSGEHYASVSSLETAIAHERANAAVLLKREIAPSSQTLPALSSISQSSADDTPMHPAEMRSAPHESDCWDIFARQRAGLTQCDDPARAGDAEPRERSHPTEAASVAVFGTAETPR